MRKLDAIICDLDGTLINCEHRIKFIKGDKKDWEGFLHPNEMSFDTINEWCLEILHKFYEDFHIIFVTGRTTNRKLVTKTTLVKASLAHYSLYMRNDNDFRKDAEVKKEIYQEHIEPFYNVIFCIDDRKQVVDMWRSLGLVCLQCAEGDY